MKKVRMMAAIVAGIALVLMVVGCATTQTAEQETKTQKKQNLIEYENIDWDGAVAGKDLPEWPYYLDDEGLDALDDYPGIREKIGNNKFFLTQGSNKDKKLAREEARNTLSFQIAQQLNTNAITTFNEVIDDREQAQETINAVASKAKFTGFERVAETWVFRLKIDHTKNDKTTEEYTYYDIFVCERDVFERQLNKYLSDIIGEVVKSENMQRANELRDGLVDELMNNDTALIQDADSNSLDVTLRVYN